MSPERRWQIRIEHMLMSIGNIQKYVAGLTLLGPLRRILSENP
jgi:uncharacterized protein with HEPN domain